MGYNKNFTFCSLHCLTIYANQQKYAFLEIEDKKNSFLIDIQFKILEDLKTYSYNISFYQLNTSVKICTSIGNDDETKFLINSLSATNPENLIDHMEVIPKEINKKVENNSTDIFNDKIDRYFTLENSPLQYEK